jgi:hypothetical protein
MLTFFIPMALTEVYTGYKDSIATEKQLPGANITFIFCHLIDVNIRHMSESNQLTSRRIVAGYSLSYTAILSP